LLDGPALGAEDRSRWSWTLKKAMVPVCFGKGLVEEEDGGLDAGDHGLNAPAGSQQTTATRQVLHEHPCAAAT